MMLLFAYILFINLIAFYVMRKDKKAAIKHRQRVPEKKLFLIAAIGGSLGSIIGMIYYHHKNRKMKFLFGFSMLFVIHTVLLIKVLPFIR